MMANKLKCTCGKTDAWVIDKENWICSYCGAISKNRTEQQSITFNHRKHLRTNEEAEFENRFQNKKFQKLSDKRASLSAEHVKAYNAKFFSSIRYLQDLDSQTKTRLLTIAHKLTDRCLRVQQEVLELDRKNNTGEKVVLTTFPSVLAAVCVILTMVNAFPKLSFLVLIKNIRDPSVDDFQKKVKTLRKRIETDKAINIFNCGIITQALEVENQNILFESTCNHLEIPYRFTSRMKDIFIDTTHQVKLKGTRTEYIIAAVISHCLGNNKTPKCLLLEESRKKQEFTLTKDIEKQMLEFLDIKKKTVCELTNQLYNVCCNNKNLII